MSANGVLVVDDFAWILNPTHNDQNRMDFQATSDGSGVVVLALSDPQGAGAPYGVEYRVNALRIFDHVPVEAVPEPSTICLILAALGMLLGARLFRKNG